MRQNGAQRGGFAYQMCSCIHPHIMVCCDREEEMLSFQFTTLLRLRLFLF